MSRSFKVNKETFEDEYKVARKGKPVRKLVAKKKQQDRQNRRHQEKRDANQEM